MSSGRASPPGSEISYSNWRRVLGFSLGRKIGGGYRVALENRVLAPLEMRETFVVVPEALKVRSPRVAMPICSPRRAGPSRIPSPALASWCRRRAISSACSRPSSTLRPVAIDRCGVRCA
ncbi:MAG: hypothetical protein WKG01_18085 [Kofleriaceae bacterium]